MSTLVVTALRVVCLAYLTATPPQDVSIRRPVDVEDATGTDGHNKGENIGDLGRFEKRDVHHDSDAKIIIEANHLAEDESATALVDTDAAEVQKAQAPTATKGEAQWPTTRENLKACFAALAEFTNAFSNAVANARKESSDTTALRKFDKQWAPLAPGMLNCATVMKNCAATANIAKCAKDAYLADKQKTCNLAALPGFLQGRMQEVIERPTGNPNPSEFDDKLISELGKQDVIERPTKGNPNPSEFDDKLISELGKVAPKLTVAQEMCA